MKESSRPALLSPSDGLSSNGTYSIQTLQPSCSNNNKYVADCRYTGSVRFRASTLCHGCTHHLIVNEEQDIPALRAFKPEEGNKALEDCQGFQRHDPWCQILQACYHRIVDFRSAPARHRMDENIAQAGPIHVLRFPARIGVDDDGGRQSAPLNWYLSGFSDLNQ